MSRTLKAIMRHVAPPPSRVVTSDEKTASRGEKTNVSEISPLKSLRYKWPMHQSRSPVEFQ
jgi:hypothetical protein